MAHFCAWDIRTYDASGRASGRLRPMKNHHFADRDALELPFRTLRVLHEGLLGGHVGHLLLQILPVAVAIAVNPVPIIAAIVMTTTERPVANGLAYLTALIAV